jgi:glycosyltransferase involved in cell wall biosynthesis
VDNIQKIRIMHLITTLDVGGAEITLEKLLASIDSKKFSNHVVSLSSIGPVGKKIKELGVPTHALLMPHGRITLDGLVKLWQLIRSIRPTILQTWLYHADFLGLLFGKCAGIPHICWNIRSSFIDLSKYRTTTRLVLKCCSFLSRLPSCIISNSNEAVNFHKNLGYKGKHWKVIHNGFDLSIYKPDVESKTYLIQQVLKNGQIAFTEINEPEKDTLDDGNLFIGYVARFDPMKDHHNFIEAAKILLKKITNVRFILTGRMVTWENNFFVEKIPFELKKYVYLLGERNDIPRITPAFDIATSASYGEGFPNIICEAMACGVPCVVTEVGDCAEIVGETGIVVEPRNPEALAGGWLALIETGKNGRKILGLTARKRVLENFELSRITRTYEELYLSLVRDRVIGQTT